MVAGSFRFDRSEVGRSWKEEASRPLDRLRIPVPVSEFAKRLRGRYELDHSMEEGAAGMISGFHYVRT